MLSDSSKSAFKMASDDPPKKLLKITKKTWNCPSSLAISEALTINPTNFLRPPFNSQFFLSFNFYLSHKTPGGLKFKKLKKIKIHIFFFFNKRISKPSLKSEKETIFPAQSTGLARRRPPPEISARWRCVPLIRKITAHYNSQFCVSLHYRFHWEA